MTLGPSTGSSLAVMRQDRYVQNHTTFPNLRC